MEYIGFFLLMAGGTAADMMAGQITAVLGAFLILAWQERKAGMAKELTPAQKKIVNHVKDSFVPGAISFEALDGDRIRITDMHGDAMIMAVDMHGAIIDDETKEILDGKGERK